MTPEIGQASTIAALMPGVYAPHQYETRMQFHPLDGGLSPCALIDSTTAYQRGERYILSARLGKNEALSRHKEHVDVPDIAICQMTPLWPFSPAWQNQRLVSFQP